MQDNNIDEHDQKYDNNDMTSRNECNEFYCNVSTDNVSDKEMDVSHRDNANENITTSNCTNHINTETYFDDKRRENHSSLLSEESSCTVEEYPCCGCSDMKNDLDSSQESLCSVMMPCIVIIGAGPTGLAAAWRLHELHYKNWVLLEQNEVVGGLARSEITPEGFTFDLGGHVTFSQEKYFHHLRKELINKWNYHPRHAFIRMMHRWVPYPFQQHIYYLPEHAFRECLHSLKLATSSPLLEQCKDKTYKALEQQQCDNFTNMTFEEYLCKTFGSNGVTSLFMRPYNEKIWRTPLHEMSATWVRDRVASVDTAMLEAKWLERQHGQTKCEKEEAEELHESGKVCICEPNTNNSNSNISMSEEDDIATEVYENDDENNTNKDEYDDVSSLKQQNSCNEQNSINGCAKADNKEISDQDKEMQSSSESEELQNERNWNNYNNNNYYESHVGWGPNAMFAYPAHGGNGALYNAMYYRCCERELLSSSSELSSSHFRVGRANRVVGIDICNDKRVLLANGERVSFDYLISTIPLDVLLRMIATSLEKHCKHEMYKFDCKNDTPSSCDTSANDNTNKNNEEIKINVEEAREVSTRNIYHHDHHDNNKEISENCKTNEVTNTPNTSNKCLSEVNRANWTFDEDKTDEEATTTTRTISVDASQLRCLASQLRYTSVHIIGLGISGAKPSRHLQRVSWMYFPDADTPFYRVTVLSNYAKGNAPAHCWSLLLEVSEEATHIDHEHKQESKRKQENYSNSCRGIVVCNSIDNNIRNLKNAEFAVNNMENANECRTNMFIIHELEKEWLEEQGIMEETIEEKEEKYSELLSKCIAACKVHHLLDESKHHIVCKWHKYIKRGYPVPTTQRDDVLHAVLPLLESKWSVWSRGRFGLWKYELSNQDHSIMQGKHAVDDILTVITNQNNRTKVV